MDGIYDAGIADDETIVVITIIVTMVMRTATAMTMTMSTTVTVKTTIVATMTVILMQLCSSCELLMATAEQHSWQPNTDRAICKHFVTTVEIPSLEIVVCP